MKSKFYLSMFVGIMTVSTVCLAYTDTKGHWAEKSIDNLSKIEVVKGYDDDTFRPDEYITRAELITTINRLLKNEVQSAKYVPDNNSKDWYYAEIKKAIASGILQGDTDGSVRPNDYVTREEAIVLLYRAFSRDTSENLKLNAYTDAKDVSNWAYSAVSIFAKEKYISGYTDATIRPKEKITRAEVMTILDRIFAEIMVKGSYEGNVYGNLLINSSEVEVTNSVIDGNLIIAEGTYGEMKLKNIIVNGNLIMRTPYELPTKNFRVNGDIIKVYDENTSSEAQIYSNEEYGISFSVPEKAIVAEKMKDEKINYKRKNLVVVNIEQDDTIHFKSFETVEKEETERYDNVYKKITESTLGTAKYGYYYDEKSNIRLIVIKRHDVVYTIYLYNVSNENVADNLLNSIELTNGEKIHEHSMLTYKNKKLVLEFNYLDYIGVDDSYNTGIVYEGNPYFMLFIQVTAITDMDEYSIEELKVLFDSLAKSEGEVIESEIKNVYQYSAIDYMIKNEEKLTRTLYVVVNNRLYKFIFTGDYEKMMSIGNELFDEVINSIEM